MRIPLETRGLAWGGRGEGEPGKHNEESRPRCMIRSVHTKTKLFFAQMRSRRVRGRAMFVYYNGLLCSFPFHSSLLLPLPGLGFLLHPSCCLLGRVQGNCGGSRVPDKMRVGKRCGRVIDWRQGRQLRRFPASGCSQLEQNWTGPQPVANGQGPGATVICGRGCGEDARPTDIRTARSCFSPYRASVHVHHLIPRTRLGSTRKFQLRPKLGELYSW